MALDIEAIKLRLKYVNNACAFDIPASTKLVFVDVPAMLAEIDRLRKTQDAAIRFKAADVAYSERQPRCELLGEAVIEARRSLFNAIDSNEGGE